MLQSLQVAHDRTGVYNVRNLKDGKRYVGSAEKSMQNRGYHHRDELNRGTHHNVHLQRAWDKYGEGSFVFECLEFCSVDNLAKQENYWTQFYDTLNSEKGYNIAREARRSPMTGRKHTEESKQKMREARARQVCSPETRQKMSQTKKGKKFTQKHKDSMSGNHWSRTDEAEKIGQKIGKALRGRVHTEEQNAVTSATTKEAMARPEVRAKLQGVNKGRKLSEDTKVKMSAAVKLRMQSVEARQKVSDLFRGKPLSEEHKAKIAAGQRAYAARKRAEKAAAKGQAEPSTQRTLFD